VSGWPLAAQLRTGLIRGVRSVFNDTAKGEKPVQRSDNALFARGSVTRRVHGDVISMSVGGVTALLLQMLHPRVLAGVWDHSSFRGDMIGRLRRTARFIAQTSFADRSIGEAAIERVREVHRHVHGVLPDGTPYSAEDPDLLAWVHVTEMWSFLAAWQRYGVPLTPAEQDVYFDEVALIGEALGADPVPRSRAAADALIATMRGELVANARTREVGRLVLGQRAPNLAIAPIQAMVFAAAVDLLPDWARAMHALDAPRLARPALRAGTLGLARTVRWAFR
jgi:uncharacterized protein (DUF2236 family)